MTIQRKIERDLNKGRFYRIKPCQHYKDCSQIKYKGREWVKYEGLTKEQLDKMSTGICKSHLEQMMKNFELS